MKIKSENIKGFSPLAHLSNYKSQIINGNFRCLYFVRVVLIFEINLLYMIYLI